MNKIHSIRESFSVGVAECEESNGFKLAKKLKQIKEFSRKILKNNHK